MADDVEALKRELEALKLQLEQERKKNTAAVAADSSQQKPAQRDQSAKSQRRGGDSTAATAPKEQRVYVQHAAVGARRGKWWLRDRQVLSRSSSEDDGGGETLKVRETWVWSGRAVVLDKIVRLDDEEEDEQEPVIELQQAKPDAKQPNDADITSVVPVEVAAAPSEISPQQEQQSAAAETSKSGEDTAPVDAPAENVAQEEAAAAAAPPLPTPAKADDEVRESSAPTAELPVADSTSLSMAVETNS